MLLGWAEGAGGLVVWSGGSVPLNTGSGGRYAAIPNTNQVIETWGLRTQDLRISGSRNVRWLGLAEREGFEPSVPRKR